ncbi:unnamed protein product [Effrenium voratum]|nr:unnamed protein product [Effrenium voratum]
MGTQLVHWDGEQSCSEDGKRHRDSRDSRERQPLNKSRSFSFVDEGLDQNQGKGKSDPKIVAEVFATGGAGITTMPLKDHGALKDHEAGWS